MIRSLPRLTTHLSDLVQGRLWLQVLIGMVAGVIFGVTIGPSAGLVTPETGVLIGNWVALPGRLFLVSIQFVVVPLVVASVIRGIGGGESTQNLGQLSGVTIVFFLITTALAVAIGLGAGQLVQPGRFIDSDLVRQTMSAADTPETLGVGMPGAADLPDLIVSLFPKDPLNTFVGDDMLQIVIAAAIIGVALVMSPADQRKPLLDLMASVQTASMIIVGWVMKFAPIAVFGLLAHITARVGLSALIGTGVYVLTVILGLVLLMASYVVIAWVFAGHAPKRFIGESRDVILMAFSTSSSAAVMPLTLTTVEQKFHVHQRVARFVVPLGTTINMGGTALYQGVATLFLAQVFGVDLNAAAILLVVVMATGAAIGSPGTPGVGIVILATILQSVGIPAAGIAIILGVDRILDMCRTAVNVTGDMAACLAIDKWLSGTHGEAAHDTAPNLDRAADP